MFWQNTLQTIDTSQQSNFSSAREYAKRLFQTRVPLFLFLFLLKERAQSDHFSRHKLPLEKELSCCHTEGKCNQTLSLVQMIFFFFHCLLNTFMQTFHEIFDMKKKKIQHHCAFLKLFSLLSNTRTVVKIDKSLHIIHAHSKSNFNKQLSEKT